MTADGSFKAFWPGRGVPRTAGVPSLDQFGSGLSSSGSLWGHWLQVLRKVLSGCCTAGRCVLVPRLSSVLKGVPNAKFTERSIAPAEVASGRRRLGRTAQSEGIPWAPWIVVSAAAVS